MEDRREPGEREDKRNIEEKPIDLDDVLVNELGQFGRFQLKNLILTIFPFFTSAFNSDFVFTAAALPHRCRIPQCGESSKDADFNPEWILNAIPAAGAGVSSCERFLPLGNGTVDYCPASLFDRSSTVECDQFVYGRDTSLVYDIHFISSAAATHTTCHAGLKWLVKRGWGHIMAWVCIDPLVNPIWGIIIAKFDLGCQDWLRAFVGTAGNIGTLLAHPIYGYVSDRFGRRVLLVVSMFNMALVGSVRAFSVSYAMTVTLELLWTTLCAGTYSAAYIFATELVGPKYRVVTSASCSSMFALGQVVLASVAWLVQPWRYLMLTLCVPCFLLVSYYWFFPESVRWLLAKKKYEEARVVLEKVAKTNKKKISEKSLNSLLNPPTNDAQKVAEPGLFKSIIRSTILLRRVCTTPIWWVSTTFIYYGLSINSTNLSDTMHLNYVLISAIEIPAYFTAVLILDRIGRRKTLFCGYLTSSLCNFIFAFISTEMSEVRLTLFLVGKFGISIVFTSMYLFTSELYPTEHRHKLLAFSSMIGRIGSITAPLTPVLMEYWGGLPSVMFGGMGVLAGLLVLTQPETLGIKLPDTLADAEALGNKVSQASTRGS